MKAKRRLRNSAAIAMAVATTVLWVSPLVWLFSTSFKHGAEAFAIPPIWVFVPTIDNYLNILGAAVTHYSAGAFSAENFVPPMLNSAMIAGTATIAALALAVPAGYVFSRIKFRGSSTLQGYILAAFFLPPLAVLIPFFIEFNYLGLLDTYHGLIYAYTTFALPLAVWLTKTFMDDIPRELDEAALIDGASRVSLFFRVIVPLAWPGIIAAGFLSFVFIWNDFSFAFFLSGNQVKLLTPFIYGFAHSYNLPDWGSVAASGILAMLPPLILSLLMGRRLERTLTLGIKG